MAIVCTRCGAKQGVLSLLTADLGTGSNVCAKCIEDEKERVRQLQLLSRRVIVTTTPNIDGFKVTNYLGVESVEFVMGPGFFTDATFHLAQSKRDAMDQLKFKAAEMGANAVVAIDIDYMEFSGNRIVMVINGTLVKLTPEGNVGAFSQKTDSNSMPMDDERIGEDDVQTNGIMGANGHLSDRPEPEDILEVLEEQARQLFAQARQSAQNADHQNASFLLQEIVRRFPKTQIAVKARRTLQKSGIDT